MADYDYLPPKFPNPYPPSDVRVTEVKSHGHLVLLRLKEKPKSDIKGDANYVLAGDYKISWKDDRGNWKDISVPQGMMTDFASVPWWARRIINRVGPWLEATVVHDFLCIAWKTMDGEWTPARRKFADDIMYATMKADGVKFKRHIIWGAIRAYGNWTSLVDRVSPIRVDPQKKQYLYLDVSDPIVQNNLPGSVKILKSESGSEPESESEPDPMV